MKLILLALFLFACHKHDNAAPSAGSAATTGSAAAAPADTADHIVVLGHHQQPKPTDPVHVEFDKFRVVKADFDPAHIEGGKATIELDLSSLHTASSKRDDHLKSESYIDVSKFATATIDIDHVKQQSGSTYAADATVTAHGVTKTYPVTFDVLSTTADSIRIKGQHAFPRMDFSIGTDPAKNPDESVAPDLTIEMVLTLK
ncbi:MAG: YceI family protein, partial [Deltaproteobacteria bacterium]|nr:YceI family protein [Deltaproteobacteria bacterium]